MSQEILITTIQALTGVTTAIITGIFGYWLAYKQLQDKYFEGLRQKRLETYPALIKITQNLGKTQTSYEQHKQARTDLIAWVTADHGGFLTLSKKSLLYFNELKELLKKQTSDNNEYSSEQLKKIFYSRNKLRGSLVDDVSISGVKESDLV